MRVGMIFAMRTRRGQREQQRAGRGGSEGPLRRAIFAKLARSALAGAALLVAAAAGAQDEERIVLELGGMTYVSSAGAANEMVIAADHATIHPDEEVAELREMHAVVAASDEADTKGEASGGLDMRCERGTFQLATGDFLAEGDVRGVTGDGRRFRTSRLRYHHDQGLVVADVPVEIRDEAGTYRGGGFRYWVHENRFRLSGGATVVQDEKGQTP